MGQIVTVTIHIPLFLRQFTDNKRSIRVKGRTVNDSLHNLVAQYPAMEKWIFTSSNSPLICIFLNKEAILVDNLGKSISRGDVIDLIPMVAGG